MYLVEWVGYNSEDDTWEPQNHLAGASNALWKFYQYFLKKPKDLKILWMHKDSCGHNSYLSESPEIQLSTSSL